MSHSVSGVLRFEILSLSNYILVFVPKQRGLLRRPETTGWGRRSNFKQLFGSKTSISCELPANKNPHRGSKGPFLNHLIIITTIQYCKRKLLSTFELVGVRTSKTTAVGTTIRFIFLIYGFARFHTQKTALAAAAAAAV